MKPKINESNPTGNLPEFWPIQLNAYPMYGQSNKNKKTTGTIKPITGKATNRFPP